MRTYLKVWWPLNDHRDEYSEEKSVKTRCQMDANKEKKDVAVKNAANIKKQMAEKRASAVTHEEEP